MKFAEIPPIVISKPFSQLTDYFSRRVLGFVLDDNVVGTPMIALYDETFRQGVPESAEFFGVSEEAGEQRDGERGITFGGEVFTDAVFVGTEGDRRVIAVVVELEEV